MKMLDKSLAADEVCGILQGTANSSGDSKVAPGYVDAFRAVAALASNQAPTVKITKPADKFHVPGSNPKVTPQGSGSDPEDGELPGESLSWTSSKDGFLGTGKSLTVELSKLSGTEQTVHVIPWRLRTRTATRPPIPSRSS